MSYTRVNDTFRTAVNKIKSLKKCRSCTYGKSCVCSDWEKAHPKPPTINLKKRAEATRARIGAKRGEEYTGGNDPAIAPEPIPERIWEGPPIVNLKKRARDTRARIEAKREQAHADISGLEMSPLMSADHSGDEQDYDNGIDSGDEQDYDNGIDSGDEQDYDNGIDSGDEQDYDNGIDSHDSRPVPEMPQVPGYDMGHKMKKPMLPSMFRKRPRLPGA